jgi:hypothetical protein
MLAGTIEGGLMGRDLKSPARKSIRFNLVLRVHQNIVYLAALFADKMLVALDQRVEMLRALARELGAFRPRPIFAGCDRRFRGSRWANARGLYRKPAAVG